MTDESRARLLAYLCRAGLSTARANAVLDNYEHRLAQKQRARADQLEAEWNVGGYGLEHEQYQRLEAMREAADFIDPKAAS